MLAAMGMGNGDGDARSLELLPTERARRTGVSYIPSMLVMSMMERMDAKEAFASSVSDK